MYKQQAVFDNFDHEDSRRNVVVFFFFLVRGVFVIVRIQSLHTQRNKRVQNKYHNTRPKQEASNQCAPDTDCFEKKYPECSQTKSNSKSSHKLKKQIQIKLHQMTPVVKILLVRMPRIELGTSSLSVTRSNHLSYTRIFV